MVLPCLQGFKGEFRVAIASVLYVNGELKRKSGWGIGKAGAANLAWRALADASRLEDRVRAKRGARGLPSNHHHPRAPRRVSSSRLRKRPQKLATEGFTDAFCISPLSLFPLGRKSRHVTSGTFGALPRPLRAVRTPAARVEQEAQACQNPLRTPAASTRGREPVQLRTPG